MGGWGLLGCWFDEGEYMTCAQSSGPDVEKPPVPGSRSGGLDAR